MLTFPKLSLNKHKTIRKLKQKKQRRLSNCFICEGFRLFNAAIDSPGIRINELVITKNSQKTRQGIAVLNAAINKKIPVYWTDSSVMKELSDEVTPPGLLFTVEKHLSSKEMLKSIDDRVLIFLDRVSEPGNLGTIMRSAVWFGINKLILSPECVDPFNAKSVRASAGAIFDIHLFPDIDFKWLKANLKKKDYRFIATATTDGVPLVQWKSESKCIIFFGQEAGGLSKDIIDSADVLLGIPGSGKIESLNLSVSVGIILYEIFKVKHGEKRISGSY
jgi:TrmH family RNA methyltransferase